MGKLNREELNKLPQNIIQEVEGALKTYDSVNIIFENGKYKISCGVMLKAQYSEDFKVVGTVYVDDIYNTNDKIINYIEEFMGYPSEYKGKKDWNMISKLGELRIGRKHGKIGLDESGNAFIKDIVELN